MADILIETENSDNLCRPSRPSLAQVKALLDFVQKHPNLAHKKLGTANSGTRQQAKKLWIQFSNIANSLDGTLKSTNGWIRFWSDKRRHIMMKQRQIEEGKLKDTLDPTEQRIYDISQNGPRKDKPSTVKRKKGVKIEPCNGDDDDDSVDNLFADSDDLELSHVANNRLMSTDSDERQLNMMEKLVEVMDQQAQAMTQMAQASHNNSKALERLAEASHIQALAVDRLASTFESINSSVHDVRNALVSIDYTMKRCYPATPTQQRQNSNLFS